MLAWLDAHGDTPGLASAAACLRRSWAHELKYWQRVFTKSDWPAPPRRMLRLAGAVTTLLLPHRTGSPPC